MAFSKKLRSTIQTVGNDTYFFPRGIKVWYNVNEASVNIVFVHGLAGDRERTWTHKSASEPWPKNLLPLYLPGARIMTFGYDAYIVQREAAISDQLVEHSRDFLNVLTSLRDATYSSTRPLIFVGHGSGGIVCKDVILQSRKNPEPHLRGILQSVVAIAFFSTPHGGSDLASWANIPAKALGILDSTNTHLLSVSQTSSEVLYSIQTDFLSMIRDLREQDRSLKITCFWESLSMPHFSSIVTKRSASLRGYNTISIHANHRDMVKFNAVDDPGFLSVLGELRRWVKDIEYFPVTYSIDDARAVELNQMRNECLKSLTFLEIDSRKSDIDKPYPHTCEWIFVNERYKAWDSPNSDSGPKDLLWIKGKPGSGKSVLMKRIAHEHEKEFLAKGILCLSFFFNAHGMRLENSLVGLYRTLLFQLLQKSKPLMQAFLPYFFRKEKQCHGKEVTWCAPELSDFFHQAVAKIQTGPVYVFIDALDECEEDEARKLIKDLEDCLTEATSNGATVKLCLSSRHNPHISLRTVTGQELFVEDHNGSDIGHYVHQELHLYGQSLHTLTKSVIRRSPGIFLWASFMVRRLLKASDQGFSPEQMTALLDSVLPSLEGLFEEILTTMEQSRRASITILAPFVICAFRLLKLREFHDALMFSADAPPLSLLDSNIRNAFSQERFQKYLVDASGGLFETNERGFVQVIHESVREFFLGSERITVIMSLPPGKRFLDYSHECILASSRHYFHVMELRRCLPPARANGSIAVTELVAMLQRPVLVPFEALCQYGVDYFHDYVFFHVREIVRYSHNDSDIRDFPITKISRTIFEGWLVLIYYSIVQNGKLSSLQHETLSLLHENTSIIGLSISQLSRVTTSINNLLIFVGQAMKDGFVLKEASGSYYHELQVMANDSTYLELFVYGKADMLRIKRFGSRRFKDWLKLKNGSQMKLPKDVKLDRVLGMYSERHVRRNGLGLGFYLVAVNSPTLSDLEHCWSRRDFPWFTIPLRDWLIVEKLEWTGSQNLNLPLLSGKSSKTLTAGQMRPWFSIMLKDKPGQGSISLLRHNGETEDLLETVRANPKSFTLLAMKDFWNLKYYALWRPGVKKVEKSAETSEAPSVLPT